MTLISDLPARLARAASEPVAVVFAGSSTTLGTGASTEANRYVNRVVASLQAAHPNGGTESVVLNSSTATFTERTTPGVHGYNAGEGGTNSTTFLTDAEDTLLAALEPAIGFLMVGSNDQANGVLPATYKATMAARLADLRAKSPTTVWVLAHSFPRMDIPTPTYTWAQYGAALSQLATDSPADTIFVDASVLFAARGVPGADPDNLIGSDNIHGTDAGHALLASEVLRLFLLAVVPPAPPIAGVLYQRHYPDVAWYARNRSTLGAPADLPVDPDPIDPPPIDPPPVDPPVAGTIARDPSWLRPGENVLDNKPAGIPVTDASVFSSTERDIFKLLKLADDSPLMQPGYVKLGPGIYQGESLYIASDGSWRGWSNTNKRVMGIIGTIGPNGELLTKIRVSSNLVNSLPGAEAKVKAATKSAPFGPTAFYWSNTGSSVPLFISGIHFQGRLQLPMMLYPYTVQTVNGQQVKVSAQGITKGFDVPTPMPWNGHSVSRAVAGSRWQFCKFEGFSFALTSAPPFELGVVNSNYSTGMTRYRVEIDGRIASEIDASRPRASGGWMLNKEITFSTIDCYDHHTRYSGNAENTNTHRTDERLFFTRHICEFIADGTGDVWSGQGNAAGFNGSNIEGFLGIAKYVDCEYNISNGNHWNLVIPNVGTTSGTQYVLPGRTILDISNFKTKDGAGLGEVGTGTAVGYPLADAIKANMQAACDTYFNIRRADGVRLQPVKASVYRANPGAYSANTHYLLNSF